MPEVNSIDVSSLPDIIITGTGFDSYDLSKNTVTLGNYTCFVKNVSETEIICSVGEIPSGNYEISVTVADKVSSLIIN